MRTTFALLLVVLLPLILCQKYKVPTLNYDTTPPTCSNINTLIATTNAELARFINYVALTLPSRLSKLNDIQASAKKTCQVVSSDSPSLLQISGSETKKRLGNMISIRRLSQQVQDIKDSLFENENNHGMFQSLVSLQSGQSASDLCENVEDSVDALGDYIKFVISAVNSTYISGVLATRVNMLTTFSANCSAAACNASKAENIVVVPDAVNKSNVSVPAVNNSKNGNVSAPVVNNSNNGNVSAPAANISNNSNISAPVSPPVVAKPVCAPVDSLIQNGGFEDLFANWKMNRPYTTVGFYMDAKQRSGRFAWGSPFTKNTNPGAQYLDITQNVSTCPGRAYNAQFAVRFDQNTNQACFAAIHYDGNIIKLAYDTEAVNTYKVLTGQFTAEAAFTSIMVRFRCNNDVANVITVDDISVTTVTPFCPDAILQNGGFEDLFSNWTMNRPYTTVDYMMDAIQRSGKYAWRSLFRQNSNPGTQYLDITQNVSTCPGVTYNAQFAVRFDQNTNQGCYAALYRNGNIIKLAYDVSAVNNYQVLTGPFTATSTSASIMIRFLCNNNVANVITVDDISITKAKPVCPDSPLQNGGFEDLFSSWTMDRPYTTVDYMMDAIQRSGKYAWRSLFRKNSNPGSQYLAISQNITTCPDATYKVSAAVRFDKNTNYACSLFVDRTGGTVIGIGDGSAVNKYQVMSDIFVATSTSSKITVRFICSNSVDNEITIDDISITKV